MKTMKKFFALLLALAMMMAMSVSASAAEDKVTITLPENGHTYKIYQIFTGTLADGELTAIKWGADGKGTTGAGVDAATLAELTALGGSNAAKGDAIKTYITGNGTEAKDTKVDVAPGYYLIEDTAINPENPNDFISLYVVKVCGAVTVSPKGDKPEVEKKVKDINDSTDADYSEWKDSADFDIGDNVPFQLTATMPSTVDGYDTYKVVFHDTLSKGLSYNSDDVITIYKDGDVTNTADTNTVAVNVSAVVADATDTEGAYVGGNTLTWTISDVLSLGATASSKIVVEYTAKLTGEGVVIGSTGNPNKVKLEYSNNPNWTSSGEGDTEPTGETPEDTAIVFTYKLVVNKVDESGAALKGAGFTLFKQTGMTEATAEAEPIWTAVGEEVKGEAMTTFTWTGVDDGNYKLVETTVPANYNKMDDQFFTVKATHTDGAEPALTGLSGDAEEGSAIVFTAAEDYSSLTSDVVNQSGAVLPETGGIGTTIFYALGGVLVAGAAILLITKKRMSNEA